jgi:hypothetical protein
MKIELTVDGKVIPLNDFTQEIIGNVVTAMAQTLRGVEKDNEEIVIRVRE